MPSGEAGVMIFNADYHVLQYCDGTNWMRVGESSEDARIGTLTAGKWCAANGGGTGLDCTQDAPVSAVTLTGDVTGTGSGSVATTIANGVVTYAKIQNTTADSVLLGRGAGAGAGTVQELMLGAGLALTGTVLSATATPTMAAGSASEVQFRNSSTGAFDADAGFAYDKTNHRLGIGTASPGAALHVAGTGAITAISVTNGTNDSGASLQSRPGYGLVQGVTNAGSPNVLVLNAFGGSVGVGTTSPAASSLLDLTSTTKGFLAPRMTSTQRDAIASPANGLVVYNTTTNVLNFWDGTAWQVVGTGGAANVLNNTTIDSGPFPQAAGSVVVPANGSYNLGSMPVEKGIYFFTLYNCNGQLSYSTGQGNTIDVVGPTILTSSSTWAELNNVPYNSCGIFFSGIFKSSGTGTASVRVQSYQGSVLVTPGPAGASFSLRGWKISGGYDASGGGGGGGGSVNLTGDVTGGGTGSIATTIANGAVSYAKLQNTSAASVLLGRGAGAGAGAVQELTLGTGLSLAGTVLSATSTNAAGSANEVQFRNSSTGAFDADSGFVYDKANHNLGIGTPTPLYPLHIVANGGASGLMALEGTDNTKEISLQFRPVGTASSTNDVWLIGRGFNSNTFQLRSWDGTTDRQILTALPGGNIGIGTTSPAYNLQVGDGTAVDLSMGFKGNSGKKQSFVWAAEDGSARFTQYADLDAALANDVLVFRSYSNDNQLVLKGDGNVGIGTASPGAKLDVTGGIQFGGNKGYLNYYNTSPYDQAEVGALGSSTSLSLVTNNISRLNITPSGYVGIGTTVPATRLDVNGTVSATQYNGLSSTNNFQRITATVRADVAYSYNYSSTVSCPANYTIINWGLEYCHAAGDYGSTNQPSYCDCSQSAHGTKASYWAPVVNVNFGASCFGLCVRN